MKHEPLLTTGRAFLMRKASFCLTAAGGMVCGAVVGKPSQVGWQQVVRGGQLPIHPLPQQLSPLCQAPCPDTSHFISQTTLPSKLGMVLQTG